MVQRGERRGRERTRRSGTDFGALGAGLGAARGHLQDGRVEPRVRPVPLAPAVVGGRARRTIQRHQQEWPAPLVDDVDDRGGRAWATIDLRRHVLPPARCSLVLRVRITGTELHEADRVGRGPSRTGPTSRIAIRHRFARSRRTQRGDHGDDPRTPEGCSGTVSPAAGPAAEVRSRARRAAPPTPLSTPYCNNPHSYPGRTSASRSIRRYDR